jgi:uroporphyrin-III C-methyltransferase/precorrin-2 dehydrogenase/sirohydrochlorin ferrochelatase
MSHRYLPISLSLKDQKCLVVGGGKIALRKVETLLNYDTEITVVAPEVQDRLQYYADKKLIKLEKRSYRSPEAALFRLVISASDDVEVNQMVHEDCRNSGAIVNVVDNPKLCDFIFPALVRREHLTAAISTDGKAPFLAGHLRAILENVFPDQWNRLVKLAADFRKTVQKRWTDNPEKRIACFTEFLEADWKTLLESKDEERIQAEIDRMAGGIGVLKEEPED